MKNFTLFSAFILFVFCLCSVGSATAQDFFSKPTGDLHNTATWGTNPDGSGNPPPNFEGVRVFALANRGANYYMTGDWNLNSIISIGAGSVLQISNHKLTAYNIIGQGALGGTPQSNLTIALSGGFSLRETIILRFAPGSNNLNNLLISFYSRLSLANASVVSPLNIYGTVSVNGLPLDLGDSVVLKSTASGTARIAATLSDVCGLCRISGNVIVERYIPPRRAWRLLSTPAQGTQTINAAWQEGATTSSANPNPNPGYGTHITGGNAADGWDQNPLGAAASIKTYNSATDTWVPVANTNATAVNATPYLVFVRGDRSIPLGMNTVPATATTLRSAVRLPSYGSASYSFTVNPQGFTAIPNPFASPINFASIRRSNTENNFFVWDPKLGGEFGVGGWVVLNFNGGGYDPIPNTGSPESQYIQSGQGFMVHVGINPGPGSVSMDQNSISTGGSDNVFRVGSDDQNNGTLFPSVRIFTNPAGLRVALQTMNSDSSFSMVDEVLSAYGSSFSNKVDSMDAHKPSNIQENLAISRDGEVLMIERRQPLTQSDVIQLKLWNTTVGKKYRLEFNANSLNTTASTAYLSDSYLRTTMPIDLHQASRMPFSVNADPASANPYRFSIAFKTDAGAVNTKTGISIYPNPVKGKSIRLSFANQPQGTYQVELVNGMGQVVYRSQINHGGGSAIQQVELASRPAAGTYLLNIINASGKNSLKVVVD